MSLPVPQSSQKAGHLILRNLYETYQSIDLDNYQEAYHDAIHSVQRGGHQPIWLWLSELDRTS